MTPPTPVFSLHSSDRASSTWLRLRTHFQARLDKLRQENDAIHLSESDRHRLLGRIQEVKDLLKLDGEERPTFETQAAPL